jgi:hypothetical protein
MTLRPEDYLDVAHDARKFRDLRRALRATPEPERFAFIVRFCDLQPEIGWWLANACLRDRRFVEKVFRDSLVRARVDRMKVLLKRVIPRIGFRRVVRIVAEYVTTDPLAADGALYALRWLVDPENSRDVLNLERLSRQAEARDIVTGPRKIVMPPNQGNADDE